LPFRRLILVKHSLPRLDPARPAPEWHLGFVGGRRAFQLAERVREMEPDRVVTSREPKAAETAEILARRLRLPCRPADGLHEQDRGSPGMLDRDEYRRRVEALFTAPESQAFGPESAAQALIRFSSAVDGLLDREPAGNLIVVTHGTVLALFAGARAGVDPWSLWQRLTLPSAVVLSLPGFRLEQVIADPRWAGPA
jgi:broad specificity phosphatase PhoE